MADYVTGTAAHGRGDRCRTVLMLTILSLLERSTASSCSR